MLDTNKYLAAKLANQSRLDPKTSISSSDVGFGRQIKDFIPIRPSPLRVVPRWAEILKQQDTVMARRHLALGKELSKHTRELHPMKVGDAVSIQKQHGNTPLKWDNTNIIMEVSAHNRYTINIDGNGRLINKNRRFLRLIRTYILTSSRRDGTTTDPGRAEKIGQDR